MEVKLQPSKQGEDLSAGVGYIVFKNLNFPRFLIYYEVLVMIWKYSLDCLSKVLSERLLSARSISEQSLFLNGKGSSQ